MEQVLYVVRKWLIDRYEYLSELVPVSGTYLASLPTCTDDGEEASWEIELCENHAIIVLAPMNRYDFLERHKILYSDPGLFDKIIEILG